MNQKKTHGTEVRVGLGDLKLRNAWASQLA